MEATIERKTATHIIMLWKYKPLNQDNALWPSVGPRIKGGEVIMYQGGGLERSKQVCVLIM
jgi:hypothetical protein